MYYVVKMVESGSVCVVRSDQLRAGGGGEVGVGALCEVGEDGQPGIIIGASQFNTFSHLLLLWVCCLVRHLCQNDFPPKPLLCTICCSIEK